jgi:hypothetical protein
MRRLALSAFVCCALANVTAAADQSSTEQRPCSADMEKYCSSSRGDREKMHQCVQQHMNDFTPACQTRMKEHHKDHMGEGHDMSPHSGATPPAGTTPPTDAGS